MSFIVWNDRLSVNIASIDQEHKEAVKILNDLYDAIRAGAAREILSDVLDRLARYTEHHFAHEEQLFLLTGYPEGESHRQQHAGTLAWLGELRRKYDEGRTGLSLEVVNYMKDWLFDHIIDSDHRYMEHLLAAGIH